MLKIISGPDTKAIAQTSPLQAAACHPSTVFGTAQRTLVTVLQWMKCTSALHPSVQRCTVAAQRFPGGGMVNSVYQSLLVVQS